jgi:hypothetical protein
MRPESPSEKAQAEMLKKIKEEPPCEDVNRNDGSLHSQFKEIVVERKK